MPEYGYRVARWWYWAQVLSCGRGSCVLGSGRGSFYRIREFEHVGMPSPFSTVSARLRFTAPCIRTCSCAWLSSQFSNLGIRHQGAQCLNGKAQMSHCEVVEMRNSADVVGPFCSRTASTQRSDCESELCESHTETCSGCRAVGERDGVRIKTFRYRGVPPC